MLIQSPPARKRILIVDDDQSIRHMLGRVLSGEGYDVVAAADGESGAQIAKSYDVDLALVDLKMPGMSGQETVKEMSASRPAMPVIVITAFARQPSDGSLAGARALMQKPLDFPTLLDTIKRLLSTTRRDNP